MSEKFPEPAEVYIACGPGPKHSNDSAIIVHSNCAKCKTTIIYNLEMRKKLAEKYPGKPMVFVCMACAAPVMQPKPGEKEIDWEEQVDFVIESNPTILQHTTRAEILKIQKRVYEKVQELNKARN